MPFTTFLKRKSAKLPSRKRLKRLTKHLKKLCREPHLLGKKVKVKIPEVAELTRIEMTLSNELLQMTLQLVYMALKVTTISNEERKDYSMLLSATLLLMDIPS